MAVLHETGSFTSNKVAVHEFYTIFFFPLGGTRVLFTVLAPDLTSHSFPLFKATLIMMPYLVHSLKYMILDMVNNCTGLY